MAAPGSRILMLDSTFSFQALESVFQNPPPSGSGMRGWPDPDSPQAQARTPELGIPRLQLPNQSSTPLPPTWARESESP